MALNAGTTITIQPGQPGMGLEYDVRQPLPYPFHIDSATGDCVRGRGTADLDAALKRPWRLIGFQQDPDVQRVDLLLEQWRDDPQGAVGMYAVFSVGTAFFNLTEPITGVRVIAPAGA